MSETGPAWKVLRVDRQALKAGDLRLALMSTDTRNKRTQGLKLSRQQVCRQVGNIVRIILLKQLVSALPSRCLHVNKSLNQALKVKNRHWKRLHSRAMGRISRSLTRTRLSLTIQVRSEPRLQQLRTNLCLQSIKRVTSLMASLLGARLQSSPSKRSIKCCTSQDSRCIKANKALRSAQISTKRFRRRPNLRSYLRLTLTREMATQSTLVWSKSSQGAQAKNIWGLMERARRRIHLRSLLPQKSLAVKVPRFKSSSESSVSIRTWLRQTLPSSMCHRSKFRS